MWGRGWRAVVGCGGGEVGTLSCVGGRLWGGRQFLEKQNANKEKINE